MPFRSIRRFAGDIALTWIMLLVCAAMTSAEAQIWKKAKEKAKAIVGNEAVAKTEELLRNAIRCAFNDDACIAKATAEQAQALDRANAHRLELTRLDAEHDAHPLAHPSYL